MEVTYQASNRAQTAAKAAGVLAARKITTPIKGLQGLMAEASGGNLLVQAVKRTNDEIGQLCGSFNAMISAQLEIVRAVNNSSQELSAASQETAATIETLAASSEQTSATAQNLYSLISRFKVDE